MRDHADQFAQSGEPNPDLQQTAQNDGRKQVFDAMLSNKSDNDDSHCACGPRYHAGAAPQHCADKTDKERRIQSNQRRNAGYESKGNRFGHQGQGHCKAGKNIVANGL